jgi:hypothetical protein
MAEEKLMALIWRLRGSAHGVAATASSASAGSIESQLAHINNNG